jgi:hypothetical protein
VGSSIVCPLAGFEELFGRADLLPEFTPVLSAERAGVTAFVEKYGIESSELWRVAMRSEPVSSGWWGAIRQHSLKLAWKLVPRGWVYQNLVSCNRRIQNFIPPGLRSKPPTISPAQVERMGENEGLRGGARCGLLRARQRLCRPRHHKRSQRNGAPHGRSGKSMSIPGRGSCSFTWARSTRRSTNS